MSGERLRDLNDLLQPSLAGAGAARPPYSIRAQVIVAILGGAFAAVGLCAASSWRIGSLRRDAWLYLAATLAAAAWIVGMASRPELLEAWGTRPVRYGQQLLGVAVVGGFYLLNRRVYKAMLVAAEEDSPSPWVAGISAIVLAWLVLSALAAWGVLLRG